MFFWSTVLFATSMDSYSNKIIPDIIKNEVHIALSFYPSLANTKIDFVFKENIKKSFMQAQPRWNSLFRNKKNRSYVILITPVFHLQGQSIPIEDLPKDVLVGWIGHELGHIMDYMNRSSLSLIGYGCGYIASRRYKTRAEKVADIHAIDHGMGQYIYEAKQYILNHAHIPEIYKDRIKRFYMSPEEVMMLVEEQVEL